MKINIKTFFIIPFILIACEQGSPTKYYSSDELNFDLVVGDWDLIKTIKGRKAIEGGVEIDYITKTMTLEKGRFNTYTTSHIPWGSKYQTELKGDTLHVYNGTNSTFLQFKILLDKDSKFLVLENLIEDEQEFYQKKTNRK